MGHWMNINWFPLSKDGSGKAENNFLRKIYLIKVVYSGFNLHCSEESSQRDACHISEWSNCSEQISQDMETSWNLTIRHLTGNEMVLKLNWLQSNQSLDRPNGAHKHQAQYPHHHDNK